MSAEDPPDNVVDLAEFRAKQALQKEKTWKARLNDECHLVIETAHGAWRFNDEQLEWLEKWVTHARVQRRRLTYHREHRCWTCHRVKHIECRGHAEHELRTHYTLETVVPATMRRQPDGAVLGGWGRVRTACKRVTSGGRSVSSWDDVTCQRCLEHRPTLVP